MPVLTRPEAMPRAYFLPLPRPCRSRPAAKAGKGNSLAEEESMPVKVRLGTRPRSHPAAFQEELEETVILRDDEVVAVLPVPGSESAMRSARPGPAAIASTRSSGPRHSRLFHFTVPTTHVFSTFGVQNDKGGANRGRD